VLAFNVFQQLQITRSNVPVTGHANRNNQIIVTRGRVVQKLRRMERSHGWMSLFPRRLSFSEMLDASTNRGVQDLFLRASPLLPTHNRPALHASKATKATVALPVIGGLNALEILPRSA